MSGGLCPMVTVPFLSFLPPARGIPSADVVPGAWW